MAGTTWPSPFTIQWWNIVWGTGWRWSTVAEVACRCQQWEKGLLRSSIWAHLNFEEVGPSSLLELVFTSQHTSYSKPTCITFNTSTSQHTSLPMFWVIPCFALSLIGWRRMQWQYRSPSGLFASWAYAPPPKTWAPSISLIGWFLILFCYEIKALVGHGPCGRHCQRSFVLWGRRRLQNKAQTERDDSWEFWKGMSAAVVNQTKPKHPSPSPEQVPCWN